MSKYKELLHNKKLMSGIYAVTLVTALLILALVIKGPEESGKLIVDSNGNVIGINRNNLKRSERYDLSLVIDDEKETIQRNVTLVLQSNAGEKKGRVFTSGNNREAEIEAEVDSLISEIEYSPDIINDKTIDPDRFCLRMIDGNSVYINPVNIKRLNNYFDVYDRLPDNVKGTLYFDSNSDNNMFKMYGSKQASEVGANNEG